MPRLWNDTILNHKAAIREAILDAVERAVVTKGLAGLTMSILAKETGIGRATLYKYFSDLAEVLNAWHARRVDRHVSQLEHIAAENLVPDVRLGKTLTAFVHLRFGHHAHDALDRLHRSSGVREGELAVNAVIASIIAEGQEKMLFRSDFTSEELARFCIGAVWGTTSAGRSQHRIVKLAVQAISV